MKKMLYILIALCLCACEEKKEIKETKVAEPVTTKAKPVKENNDKYVYIDAVKCLHIDKSCIEMLPITYARVSAERTVHLHRMQYIEKNKLMPDDIGGYCSECTKVGDFEEIEEIVRVNSNRRKAYDLLDRHFNMPPYDEFYTMLDGEEGQKKAYNSLIENSHKELGENYEEFLNNICLRNQPF